MKRLIKLIGIFLCISLLTIMSLAFLLPALLDPNSYKENIVKILYSETGLQATIAGDIKWALFPSPALAISSVDIRDRKGDPLAGVDLASVKVSLLPLLTTQTVQINSILIENARLRMGFDEEGTPNWKVRLSSQPSQQTAMSTDTYKENFDPAAPGKPSLPPVNIHSISLTNSQLNYFDQRSGQKVTINNLNLSASKKKILGAYELMTNFDLAVSNIKNRLSINATAVIDDFLSPDQFNLDDLRASVFALDQKKPEIAKFNSHGVVRNNIYEGRIALENTNIARLLEQFGHPLKLADKNALSSISLYSQIQMKENALNLDDIKITLDRSKLSGNFRIESLKPLATKFNLSADVLNFDNYLPDDENAEKNTLNTKPVLPAETVVSDQKSANHTGDEQPLIAEKLFDNIRMEGQIDLMKLVFSGLTFEDVRLKTDIKDNSATVSELFANAYDGVINGAGQIWVAANSKIKLTGRINGVSLENLAQDIPELSQLAGKINADVNITATGNTVNSMTRSLDGTMAYGIQDGAFLGMNIDSLLCESIAKVRKEKLTKSNWDKNTQFKQLDGSFTFEQGIASNNDFKALLSTAELTGSGQVDLVSRTVDYALGLNITGSQGDESENLAACKINEAYSSIVWPFRCSGSLNAIKNLCSVDLEKLIPEIGNIAIDELKNKATKNIEKKLKDRLGSHLDDFFNK